LVAKGEVIRFQGAFVDEGELERLLGPLQRAVAVDTGAPVQLSVGREDVVRAAERCTGAPVRGALVRRAEGPTVEEQGMIRRMFGELGSLNRTVVWAYGAKNALTFAWVRAAVAAG
jgi:hypothetical protein